MSDVLDKIMTFINENTYILIGICIFLILVLIGYLIDNSVKSKRIRKDIKNKDQVPENIKNEIIKDAIDENMEENIDESLRLIEENQAEIDKVNTFESESVQTNDSNVEINNDINMELNLNDVSNELNLDDSNVAPLILDNQNDSLSLDLKLDFDNTDNGIVDDDLSSAVNLNLELSEENVEVPLDLNIETPVEENILGDLSNNLVLAEQDTIVTEEMKEDPDSYVLEKQEKDSKYKNDKKLSDILSQIDKVSKIEVEPLTEGIFDEPKDGIIINNNVNKEDVEIEKPDESSNELDRIMKKLSANEIEDSEDNYTNIF